MTTRPQPPRTHGPNSPRRPNELRRDLALDLDRTASMADEGGSSGATMDLNDQLAHARSIASRPPVPPRNAVVWGGPLAATIAGVLAGVLLGRDRAAHA
jgi:hypothetical protein